MNHNCFHQFCPTAAGFFRAKFMIRRQAPLSVQRAAGVSIPKPFRSGQAADGGTMIAVRT
jgi:hypothetical protein